MFDERDCCSSNRALLTTLVHLTHTLVARPSYPHSLQTAPIIRRRHKNCHDRGPGVNLTPPFSSSSPSSHNVYHPHHPRGRFTCRPKLSNAPAKATQTTYLQSSPPGDPATA